MNSPLDFDFPTPGPLYGAMRLALEYYDAALWSERCPGASEALAYLTGRGLSEGVLRAYRVGYAPDRWDTLAGGALGLHPDVLLAAGLTKPRPRRAGSYDRLRGRIVCPVVDQHDRPCGYTARDVTGQRGAPKYINTPRTAIYDKSAVLYGWRERWAARQSTLFIAEGAMDVLAIAEAGYAAVAPCGTAFTAQQAALCRQMVGNVTLVFDDDAAGQEAAWNAARVATAAGLWVYAVQLPDGLDPGDVVQQRGGAALRAMLEQPVPIVSCLAQHAEYTGYDAAERTHDEQKRLLAIAAEAPPLIQNVLLRQIAEAYGVPHAWVADWLADYLATTRPQTALRR